jgi:branched-chain amino acid transport system ATP-binding protein
MSEAVLSVRGLSAGYGDILAIRDVDIDVRPGEIVTVLGTNGAGKTTLLNALAGLVPVMSGSVLLDGEPIERLRAHARARRGVSLVQENKRIFRALTVRDNLVVAASRLGRAEFDEQESAVYALFPALADKRHDAAGSLSGGQQQMLAIGQALMARPSVLLLDEPAAGLAPLLVAEVMDRVRDIAGRGIGVLLVEQAVHQALRVASVVYVLRLGICTKHEDFRAGDRRQLLERIYLGGQSRVAVTGGQSPGATVIDRGGNT